MLHPSVDVEKVLEYEKREENHEERCLDFTAICRHFK